MGPAAGCPAECTAAASLAAQVAAQSAAHTCLRNSPEFVVSSRTWACTAAARCILHTTARCPPTHRNAHDSHKFVRFRTLGIRTPRPPGADFEAKLHRITRFFRNDFGNARHFWSTARVAGRSALTKIIHGFHWNRVVMSLPVTNRTPSCCSSRHPSFFLINLLEPPSIALCQALFLALCV